MTGHLGFEPHLGLDDISQQSVFQGAQQSYAFIEWIRADVTSFLGDHSGAVLLMQQTTSTKGRG